MSNTAKCICLSVLGFLLLATASHAARASSLPAGFADTLVSRPDGRPWDDAAGVAFADDGRMLVWERTGRVWLLADSATARQPLVDLSDEVSSIGSLGLTGLALDPQFEQNGFLYLFYAVDPQYLANCDAPATGAAVCRATYRAGQHASSGATIGRLVRYQLVRPAGAPDFRAATTVNLASRRVLLGETPVGGVATGCVVTDSAHGTGALAFGSDGTLLVGCGDGAGVSTEDSGSDSGTQYRQALAERLMTPAENVGAFRAQLVDSLSGKILRLDAATGDGVPGNPFYDSKAPRAPRSRVWVLGLHDPQHFTVRPGSGSARVTDGRPGTLYIGEAGYSSWEALVIARDGRMNFGWPLYEGVGNDTTLFAGLPAFNLSAPNPLFPKACSQRYFRFRDLITADSLHASWPNPCQPSIEVPATDDVFVRDRPAIDWQHTTPYARWAAFDNSGEPLALPLGTPAPNGALVLGPVFGGTASIGGVWYQGSSFPAGFRDVYYHADSGGEWIKAFEFDANDNPVAVRDFLGTGGQIRALGDDPRTGELYYITGLPGSEVHRLTYSPATVATVTPAALSSSATPSALTQAQTSTSSSTTAPSSTRKIQALAASSTSSTSSWSSGDVGSPGAAGSYSVSGGTFTVNGSGTDIYNNFDAFQFVSQPLTGDGSITARVVSQSNTSPWAKAGVMIRENLGSGSTNAFVPVTPQNGVVFQDRATTGGASTTVTSGPIVAAPYWVRLVRAGNLFSAYASADGTTWTSLGQATISMASQVYIGLAVTSHKNGTLGTAVFDNVTLGSPQGLTVPTGLAATSVTTNSASLSWSASTDGGGPGVGGYYVYRNGNTTTPIATITSGTSFTDTGLAATTTYTYQVAAFDKSTPATVSALSSAVSVTTLGAGASGWSSGDIGAPAAAGSFSVSGSTFTVNGSGSDVYGNADAFQFVSQSLTGDGSITARVVSQTNTSAWAKAGVMIRETLAAGATNAFVPVTPQNGVVFQDRATTGGASGTITFGPIVAAPYWVRLVRAGNTFSAYASADGSTWSSLGQITISMASQAYAGLAVTSHNDGTLGTAVFDNVTVNSGSVSPPPPTGPTVPTGLAAANVTTSSVSLSWTASTDNGGPGVGGYYVYRNGNTTTPIATVASGTSFTDTGLTASTTYTYQVAAFDKSTPANVSAPTSALSVTTQTASGGGAPGWSNQDIGGPAAAGSYSFSGSTFTVNGSGSDIYVNADAFQFVSQVFTGDGSITARVVSQSNTNAWAKAGVMIRETLTAGSTNAFVPITPQNGVVFQDRATTGGASATITYGPIVATPYWVRLVRAGSTFSAYASADGTTWTSLGQTTISMASQVYAGLAVTSHNNGTLGTAVFDNVSVSNPQGLTVPTGLGTAYVTTSSVSLSWTASTDNGGPGVGGYYVYRNGNTTTPIATVTSGTSFIDTGLTASTAYTYQVAAFDKSAPANVSALSSSLSVTTQSGGASGWSSGDLGGPAAAGSYSFSGTTFTVNGSGSDIYGTADSFQFVSQVFTGDGSITARVVSQTNTNAWAKAGVMIRETLTAGATNAFVPLTPQNGVVFQARATTSGASSTIAYGPVVAAPYWVRLVRAGSTFSAYASADGTTWTSLGQTTISMASQVYAGLAVTSHNDGTLGSAVFDNLSVTQALVTPHVASITPWQSQQFTMAASGGATWTVDGINGGNSTVGTISSTGLFTPGSAAGAHTVVATSIADPALSSSAIAAVTGLPGVYTYHNDVARDGTNSQEYALTPATVNSAGFSKLFSCTVDGAVYAQPLWVAGLSLSGVQHNVVFVATEHDSLYAFDADATPCVQLWKVSVIDTSHGGASGETTVPAGPTGNLVGQGYGDITPEVGVTGTPVIDPATGTLYVVSKSVNAAGTTFYQRLHAIDLTTGNEKPGSPVTIAGTYPGSGDGGNTVTFNPRQQLQRPGLALVNGTVYIAWGAHEDTVPWYGWMIGYTYNGSTFTQTAAFTTTPNKQEAGIWMSGGAPAADSSNNLYVSTGNGAFDVTSTTGPKNDYGDTVLKLSSTLTEVQYWTPSNQATLNANDADLGAGGPTVLPDLPAGSPIPHLFVAGGKDQFINLLNRDQLGGLGDAYAVQKTNLGASIFGTGAFWNNTYYIAGTNGPLSAYLLNPSVPAFNFTSSSPHTYGFPGSTPSVSAAGTAKGVVWTLDTTNYCTKQSPGCGPAVLHANDAANLATELWNSSLTSTDTAGNAVKFTVPTVANGKVYIGTRGNNTGGVNGSTTVSGELDVYGLKPN